MLALRLGVIAVAVLVTLLTLGPLAQTSAWLAAAAAVAIAFRRGRDAIDWIARGVGLGLVAVILTGPLLDAAGLRLWSSTWAVTVGTLAAIVVVVGHLRRTASTRTPEPLGAPVTEDDHGAETTDTADAGDPHRRRRSLLWGAAAVLLVVGSLIGTGISGRTGGPDVEMWLENPADVATGTAR